MTNDSTVLMIDGFHIYRVVRNLGFEVDYKHLLDHFSQHLNIIRPYYFTTILDNDEYSPTKPLVDYLVYNRFTVITKKLDENVDSQGRRRTSGNVDVEIAVSLLEVAEFANRIVLFAGDAVFCRPVESVQRKGVQVSLVSSMKTSPNLLSDALRRIVDGFTEIDDIREQIKRPSR